MLISFHCRETTNRSMEYRGGFEFVGVINGIGGSQIIRCLHVCNYCSEIGDACSMQLNTMRYA